MKLIISTAAVAGLSALLILAWTAPQGRSSDSSAGRDGASIQKVSTKAAGYWRAHAVQSPIAGNNSESEENEFLDLRVWSPGSTPDASVIAELHPPLTVTNLSMKPPQLSEPGNHVLLKPAPNPAANLSPGIYRTEPYSMIVIVPGKQLDENIAVNLPQNGSSENFPIRVITPELRFIPISK